MKWRSLWRWTPAAGYLGATIFVVFLVLLPSHRDAQRRAAQIRTAERELEAGQRLLAQLPRRRAELDTLLALRSAFATSLRSTAEIDLVMSDLVDRASGSDIEFWTLNPSLPDMIELDRATDSVSRLDMATLRIEFVCRGEFVTVGRFLEAQELRLEFGRWRRLTITADPRRRGVHASGEFEVFLLPPHAEESS